VNANDLPALRMRFAPGQGERPGGNPVLKLCDEVEELRTQLAKERRTNAELAKALSGHLHEAAGNDPSSATGSAGPAPQAGEARAPSLFAAARGSEIQALDPNAGGQTS
jgi:hypothetical protein